MQPHFSIHVQTREEISVDAKIKVYPEYEYSE